MNLLYKSDARKVAMAMLLLCSGQFLAGCSKDKESQIIDQPSGDGTKLKVSVAGITDGTDIAINPKAGTSSRVSVKQVASTPKVMRFNGFDAVTSLEENVVNTGVQPIGKVSKGTNTAADLKAAAIAANVKYRFVLYKVDGTFVSSSSLTSATVATLDVERGKNYKWYALSYNDTTTVPDVTDRINPSLVLPGNKDVLFASGNINIPVAQPVGDLPLPITFKHRFARVGVEINTQGMFADMTALGARVTGLAVKTGTLNLKTGALTSLTASINDLNATTFTDIETGFSDRKIAYFYTADSTASQSFTVQVNQLSLSLEGGVTRAFTTLATAPSSFTFANVSPVIGTSASAKINLLESALNVGGVSWARGNLYLSGATRNRYRFEQTYALSNRRSAYWAFGATDPTTFSASKGDPCALVYPAGIWRTPTQAQFTALAGVVPASTAGGAISYNTSATANPAYPGNDLRLYMNGQYNSLGIVNGLINAELGSTYGTNAEYWTTTPLLNVGGLLTLGAYGFSGTTATRAVSSVNVLNLGLAGLGLLQTDLKNVRCVRN